MPFRFRPFNNALLVFAAVVTPVALGSSSAVLAQTTEPQLFPAVAAASEAALPDAADETSTTSLTESPDPLQVECIAKVIMHEAAYEPRAGRVAVAQVIRSRVRSGRFAADPCGVARQRGQFFDIDAFQPARGSSAWAEAVTIAAETLSGTGDEVAPGALFFHAAYAPMARRVKVAQIGGHVFYR